jgi:hypothetical protein
MKTHTKKSQTALCYRLFPQFHLARDTDRREAMRDTDSSWSLKGLGAKKESSNSQGEKLSTFGRFVGDWAGEAFFLQADGSEVSGGREKCISTRFLTVERFKMSG